MDIIKKIKADINSDGEMDVTFKDILSGKHLDGKELYISNEEDGIVTVVDTDK